jgi:DNA invertase Pin-like site-specific DNA recombinase
MENKLDQFESNIKQILENYGIKQNCHSWVEYEKGKKILRDELPELSLSAYRIALTVIINWVGV